MNESDYNQLREESWRRKLTPAEEAELRAWLADHPECRMDWDMDSRLTHLLGRLDNAPVPSNFTARVLQAVEREAAAGARQAAPKRNWFLHSFLPRTAAAMVVVAAGLLAYHEHVTQTRAELVRSVKMVANVPSLPSPEILLNLDVIRQMNPGPDQEIIALMQ